MISMFSDHKCNRFLYYNNRHEPQNNDIQLSKQVTYINRHLNKTPSIHYTTTSTCASAVHSLLLSHKTILLQIVVDCDRGSLSQNTGFGDIKNSGSVSLGIIYLFLPFGSCVLISSGRPSSLFHERVRYNYKKIRVHLLQTNLSFLVN